MTKDRRKRGKRSTQASTSALRRRLVGLMLLSGLGAGLSAWLTWVHYVLLSNPGAGSACNFGGYLDCDAVNASRFADVGGVPIAFAGLVLYGVLGARAALDFKRGTKPAASIAYARGAGALAVVVSIVLALISVLVIQALCVFCVGLYAVNLGIAGIGWLRPPPGSRFFARLDQDLRRAGAGRRGKTILLGSAGGLVAVAVALSVLGGVIEEAARSPVIAKVKGRALRSAPGHTEGAKTPRLTVLEFSDFECPFCAKASSTFARLRKTFAKDVLFVYKHFPLHGSCNPAVPRGAHDKACGAAAAAVCAGEQGLFWPFHHQVFLRGVSATALPEAAREVGLDVDRWQRCRWSRRAAAAVSADVADGIEIGVTTTPTFVIGDEIIVGARPYDELAAAIRRQLP